MGQQGRLGGLIGAGTLTGERTALVGEKPDRAREGGERREGGLEATEARGQVVGRRAGGEPAGCSPTGPGSWLSKTGRFPSPARTRRGWLPGAQRKAEVWDSPLVMVISVSLRVVLATHVYHDVTGSQFFGVPGPHNLCILQGTPEVRGGQGRADRG